MVISGSKQAHLHLCYWLTSVYTVLARVSGWTPSQHHSDDLLLTLGMAISRGKKATPCLGILSLPSFSKSFWAGITLSTHSNDLLLALGKANGDCYSLVGLSGLPFMHSFWSWLSLSTHSDYLLQAFERQSPVASWLLLSWWYLNFLYLHSFGKRFWMVVSLSTHSDDLYGLLEWRLAVDSTLLPAWAYLAYLCLHTFRRVYEWDQSQYP